MFGYRYSPLALLVGCRHSLKVGVPCRSRCRHVAFSRSVRRLTVSRRSRSSNAFSINSHAITSPLRGSFMTCGSADCARCGIRSSGVLGPVVRLARAFYTDARAVRFSLVDRSQQGRNYAF